MIGQTISHYSIVGKLGKGGMGEVYQAKDQKLGRDVAIKVLPEEFAKDTERVARFQREAKLLASLNHPNIAVIYGVEEAEGKHFLVLELVEGETLSEQLKRGPLPVEEALRLALQIAEALEAAHEKGVIHRDLKPANIKVTPEGKVKVLDFGLAKAFAGEQEEMVLSDSPTLSVAETRKGVILGTAAYMSPEQARGKSVDKRADIWAFGCVLYEMLTGRAAFSGNDVTDILAAVIRAEPEWSSLPKNLHGRLREVLERCLEKDARNRYSGINDARVDIQKVLADPSGVFVSGTIGEPRKKLGITLSWVAAIILAVIIAGMAVWKLKPSEPRQIMRFDYELPEDQQFSALNYWILAVSPDGKQFIYSTPTGLYLRSVDELTAKLIPGTEESVQNPFFSPDGKWIGYFSVDDGQLKKISINGGAPVTLCAVSQLAGAWWGTDNAIVYAELFDDIMRVSANGGTPESLIKVESFMIVAPQVLPDGKSVLYGRGAVGQRMIMVQSLESGETKELFAAGSARYIPTGHIVYWLQNNLYAVPFDLGKLEVTGGPVPVVEGAGGFVISDTGTLVYIPQTTSASSEGAAGPQRTLVWVDRKGREEPLDAPTNTYRFPKVSPDGTQVALCLNTEHIWIWDVTRKTLTPLTFEGAYHINPVWTSDGKRIVFFSFGREEAGDSGAIYWKASDGTGEVERLGPALERAFFPYCFSSDGKALAGAEMISMERFDIGIISMEDDRQYKPLLQQEYLETQPQISHDGKYIAYTSGESGQNEIYVRPFPDVNKGRWRVSTNGGDSPLWSPDGRELFYLVGNTEAVMRVAVETEPTFKAENPEVLFQGKYVGSYPQDGTPWDIHPDGKRFLMIKPPGITDDKSTEESTAEIPRKINIVLNWLEELKQRVPVD